ncbi:MAG: pitrilysin family protein [Deltaproteobacteria bacterium]|nr:pitrilysin family protein [Deltaproteobacteria bacterium]
MFAKTVLDNGIRILSEERPGARSVSLGIWVENGSRHESRHQSGISHFIEHLLFKGTERRSATQIAEEMDTVGGVLNAFTGKETTCYYAKVLDENLPLAIDLLSDLFLHSVFDGEEIERERSVVFQEISQAEDTPEDYVHDLFSLDFFGDHPLGRPICGEVATVSSFQREDFLNFVRGRYLPGRVIIVAAGNCRHNDLVERLAKDFSALKARPVTEHLSPVQFHSGVVRHSKPLEQVHLCFGFAGIHHSHEKRYVAYLLNTHLGGGMSSRLFQEIREKRGKAYSIYSFMSSYRDVGYLGIYAGTKSDWVEEVVDVITTICRRFIEEEISEEDLARAKSQVIGNTILGLESSDSWMSHLARNEIYFGKAISMEEISEGIRVVSREDIIDLAREIFRPEGMALTLLGNVEKISLDLRL